MTPRLRTFITAALPLSLLGGLALILSSGQLPPGQTPADGSPSGSRPGAAPGSPDLPHPSGADGTGPVKGPAGGTWIFLDPARAESLDRLPGWDARRGGWELTPLPAPSGDSSAPSSRRMLSLLPEPMVEGKLVCARTLLGAGGVKALMRGERSRRAWPRFSVALHQADREFHLRAFPDTGRLDLVSCDPTLAGEQLLASAPPAASPWEADPAAWIWLELLALPVSGSEDTFSLEGRLWKEGQPRPEAPVVTHSLALAAPSFKAAVQGAPFALKPILIGSAAALILPSPQTP